jgi:hypothetical protein
MSFLHASRIAGSPSVALDFLRPNQELVLPRNALSAHQPVQLMVMHFLHDNHVTPTTG